MCGICGVFSLNESLNPEKARRSVAAMTRLMAHRGPDDEGYWSHPDHSLFLGFRRLAILDLSPAAHQPMESINAPAVLAFNGEIYNFQSLRKELESRGVRFRSHSDSEVLLEALNMWEEDALPRLNGMFAFAWYHLQKRKLILARDHAGIKPLHYLIVPGKGLVFGSQYNQLLYAPWGLPEKINPHVLFTYLKLHYIPPPYGLMENTAQVAPGEMLIITADGTVKHRRWWQLPRRTRPVLRGEEALEATHAALKAAVKRQLIADVPVGTFLSGGIDSPLVTAIAAKEVGSDLKAFTIGNPGWTQDEAPQASDYAGAIGVRHYVQNLTPEEIIAAIEELLPLHHEPLADYSTIPTYLISRFARQKVTVALSGDGGDELFFGYARPRSLTMSAEEWKWPRWVRMAKYALGKYGIISRRNSSIVSPSPEDYYREVNSRTATRDLRQWAPKLPGYPPDLSLFHFDRYQGYHDLLDFSRYVEFYGQLQRCLRKVDLASMQCSLEIRVPVLDREVVETSLQIDPTENIDATEGKKILRRLLARYVPPRIISRKKLGFSVPLGKWLRGPLRPLAEDLLLSGPLFPEGMFDKNAIKNYWETHRSGQRNLKWSIWTLMVLQYWARHHYEKARAFHQQLHHE